MTASASAARVTPARPEHQCFRSRRCRDQRVARAPTVSRVSTSVSHLRALLDVRARRARPACLGEEVECHVLVVADWREGLIRIRPRLWIARDGHRARAGACRSCRP